ncbi:peptidoglycan DD-metalloendopeptidase family protein [Paenalcaligenes niemegkensis]|uniref:peptidoglycan DD-metalloendopeptidase family protein n=1 Tax=Paenalcaligenes niemegkensis TaxID=2895469 RepID=UPI001EE93D15|nr:peptidoglycan DD-metalloendopeptidase family protein [Paenalcaligenes niemegkensis]MCQ9616244.1 peptidoglycan DD-metalloendopeptidase family protein [Paenalcaligenes niemegkensis]
MQHLGKSLSPAARDFRFRPLLASVAAVAVLLVGCASRTDHAPIVDGTSGAPTSASAAQGSYVVQSGDTLYKIAQMHNMSVATLISINNITDPSQLRVGQSLTLDGSESPAGPTVAVIPPLVSTTPATPEPLTPVQSEQPTSAPRASDASLISWGWPASGKVIQSFNANTKGIDLAGAVGDAINAAADGKVMYAGNGVRGLGNLILLGHSNGFITAYAHNDSLSVKTGDEVKKGQRIAALGQTDTTSPRLHFEVRRRGTPVNPLSYLPER